MPGFEGYDNWLARPYETQPSVDDEGHGEEGFTMVETAYDARELVEEMLDKATENSTEEYLREVVSARPSVVGVRDDRDSFVVEVLLRKPSYVDALSDGLRASQQEHHDYAAQSAQYNERCERGHLTCAKHKNGPCSTVSAIRCGCGRCG